MAADTTQAVALPQLKPEKKAAARLYKGDEIMPPLVQQIDVPEGAVMMLPNGDWCDKDATLRVLKGEGDRALTKAANGVFSEVAGGAGASSRERSLRDVYKLVQKDDLKAVSRKLFGHDKAKWFRLTDIKHPEVRTVDEKGEPTRAEVQWDAEE